MIVAIGEWVMQEACQEAQRWQREGLTDVPVAVNLSAHQFCQSYWGPALALRIAAAAAGAGGDGKPGDG